MGRPSAVRQIATAEDAERALNLGFVLIAVDPNTPNIMERLSTEAKAIRANHPLPLERSPGRPSRSIDIHIDDAKVQRWRDHRIVALYDFRLMGHHPSSQRKQVAAWMFPET